MPFYEYQCSDCGEQVEALQKISDPPLRECPSCKHESLTRLMSAPAFRLKGGGWYETDFKSGDSKRNLADSGSSESSSSSSSSSTSSAKPAEASKSETKKESAAESKPAAKPAETKSTTTV